MTTLLLSALFLLMIAAPCVVAVRSSRKIDDSEAKAEADAIASEVAAAADAAAALQAAVVPARPRSLRELAAEAEIDAKSAQDVARQAHWAALAAEARAAALRADAAAEAAAQAGRLAERAIRAAEATIGGNYLPESHPSLDFPRSRAARRRAA